MVDRQKRFTELLKLKHGWDGYSARPIDEQTIICAQNVITVIDALLDPEDWSIYPTLDGGISIEGQGYDVGFEIDEWGTLKVSE